MLYYSNEYQLSIKLCLFLTIFFQNSCLQTAWILLYYTGAKIIYAPVAQLDRVTDSDSVGRWFESSRAYHRKKRNFVERQNSSFLYQKHHDDLHKRKSFGFVA